MSVVTVDAQAAAVAESDMVVGVVGAAVMPAAADVAGVPEAAGAGTAEASDVGAAVGHPEPTGVLREGASEGETEVAAGPREALRRCLPHSRRLVPGVGREVWARTNVGARPVRQHTFKGAHPPPQFRVVETQPG